jgi:hypothetical protein
MHSFDDDDFDGLCDRICRDGCHSDPYVRAMLAHCVAVRSAAIAAARDMCAAGVPDDGTHPLSESMAAIRMLTRRTAVVIEEAYRK